MKVVITVAIALVATAPLKAQTSSVPTGVYDCFGPGMAEGGMVGHGAGQLNVSGAKFSVVGPGQYLSRQGKTGHFAFDGVTLSMSDGPYRGLRFHKVASWSFRMLRENGVEGPFMCPRNSAKDPRKPDRW